MRETYFTGRDQWRLVIDILLWGAKGGRVENWGGGVMKFLGSVYMEVG